ncbi:MAG: hypothetical protein V8R51_03780 [Clostridia bacterium]
MRKLTKAKRNRPQMSLNKRRRISNMKMTEILIIIVNISIFILPIVMLIENLIKGRYRVLNICMLINMFAWVYLSYLWNVRNPGFWIKCDTRILTLIASILFIVSIIAFAIQLKHKKGNKLLIMIAIIFVYYIIMTNDTTYEKRTRVDTVAEKTIREYVLEEHVPYLAFLSIEIELFINLLNSRKSIKDIEKESKDS